MIDELKSHLNDKQIIKSNFHCLFRKEVRQTMEVSHSSLKLDLCLSNDAFELLKAMKFNKFLDITLHAKGQTLNIYSVNSAPNRRGIHSLVAHLYHYNIQRVDFIMYILKNLLLEIFRGLW